MKAGKNPMISTFTLFWVYTDNAIYILVFKDSTNLVNQWEMESFAVYYHSR